MDDETPKVEPQVKPKRRRRRWLIAGGVALVVVLAGAFALRTPSPVGHWRSAEGYDAFVEAYDAAFADMPEPDETLDVRTDFGVVRFYRFTGTGDAAEPLVLLPGRASASPVWAGNLPSLLAIGDVYTVDLLGEPGMSVQDRPIEDDADQAEWLDQALAGLPEDRFNLVGVSIGGWTAANLAVRQPERVASVTLVDAVFVFDGMPVGTMIRSIPASVPWFPKSWRDGFNSYTAGGAEVEDVPVADMIEAGMQHYQLRLPAPTQLTEDQLSALEMPVLAIIAGESVMHDPATARETAERVFPDGSVVFYEDATHAVNGEHPAEIAANIAELLGI